MSAADVIGILGFALHAAHKIYDIVQDVREAPEKVRKLKEEASDISRLYEQLGIRRDSVEGLILPPGLAERGEDLLKAGEEFVDKVTKLAGDGTRNVKTIKWMFKITRATKLEEAFTKFRRELTDACVITTLYVHLFCMVQDLSTGLMSRLSIVPGFACLSRACFILGVRLSLQSTHICLVLTTGLVDWKACFLRTD